MADNRSKEITFVMVGHAHLDPVWLWDWREGFEAVRATFRSALDRMKENPDLVFVHSSAAQYAWMEVHPELLAEIRDAVARGQWEPVGGLWVEPDMNIPSGESLARQGLHGQRYMKQVLGRTARVAFLPDSFGHPATLPQIFRQAGLEYFVFMRPNDRECALPSNLFWWEGPDGTQVLAARAEAYSSNPLNVSQSLTRNIEWRPEDAPEWFHLFGVGNHGGGPTRKGIQNIRELNAAPDWPTLSMGRLDGFFDRAAARSHPVFAGELQHHARGCYTSHSLIKRLNRRTEQLLLAAEKWAVISRGFGMTYPKEALNQAWKQLLFNQFHDVLAGTSIAPAYEDARNELGEALAIGDRTSYQAMQRVAARIDTRRPEHAVDEVIRRGAMYEGGFTADLGDGVPLILFNPSPWPRSEVVEVEVNDWTSPNLAVLDDQDRLVEHQLVRPGSSPVQRRRPVFLAELPPLGYRLYRLVEQAPEAGGQASEEGRQDETGLRASATQLENRWWRIQIDPETGTLSSLYDRQRGVELLAGAGAQLLVINDPGSPWGNEFRRLRHLVAPFGRPEVKLIESGPVRATVMVTLAFGRSVARQEITIYRDLPAIHGRVWLNWQEQMKAVKLAFPFAIDTPTATFSAPYGHVVRPAIGDEEPVQQWLDLSGQVSDLRGERHDLGVALLNDCKYGADVLGGEIRLTLLRSPAAARGTPSRLDPEDPVVWLDQGEQELRWGLHLHEGVWQEAGVVQAAESFNQPVGLVREFAHAGDLPKTQSFLRVTPPEAVVVTALKEAEEGPDLILRLYEPAGRHTTATISLPSLSVQFAIAVTPHQIKTYRVSAGGAVREVDFLEE